MHSLAEEPKSTIFQLIQLLEPTVEEFSREYEGLYEFWSENFQFYLKRSIKTLKKKNFRRNFQGRVVDSILSKEMPDLVLNLFAGYLGTFHAVLNNRYFSQIPQQHQKNKNEFVWINIDLLPESVKANCEYLNTYWGINSKRIGNTDYAVISQFPRGIMIHLVDDLTQIHLINSNWNKLCKFFSKPVLFGIEGIMNLPLIIKKDFMMWWEDFKQLIKPSNLFFGSWMATGENWEGLLTKLTFYDEVVKKKHGQPFIHGKLESIDIDSGELDNSILWEDNLPWDLDYIKKEILDKCDQNKNCIVVTYYSAKVSSKKSLQFVSSYISEKALIKLCRSLSIDSHTLWTGYERWEKYFGLEIDKKGNKQAGFVKILPFGFKSVEE